MKSISLHGSIDHSITNQLTIMESLCGRGLFLERGEGPVGEGGEGLSTSFLSFFCITGIKIVFGLVFWFISLKCCGGSRFFFDFFSLSHVTLLLIQSTSYIKDRLRNLTSFFSIRFLNFRAIYWLLCWWDVVVYIVDVDDASEEKVVISEQHWEWFVCFCLITLIKVAIVVLAFCCHPLDFLVSQNRDNCF